MPGTEAGATGLRASYLQLVERVLRDWRQLEQPDQVLDIVAEVHGSGEAPAWHVRTGPVERLLPSGFQNVCVTVGAEDGERYSLELAFFQRGLANFRARFEFVGRDGIDAARRFNASDLCKCLQRVAGPEAVRPGDHPDSFCCEDLHGACVFAEWVFGSPAVAIWASDQRFR